jgi:hypothetical protein
MKLTKSVALAAALMATGCGGDRLTKDEYVKQAQTLCASANKRLEKAGRAMTPAMTERDFVEQSVVPIVRGTLDALAELDPPEADEARLAAMIESGRRALQRLRADPNSIRAAEGSRRDPFQEFDRRARSYGIDC